MRLDWILIRNAMHRPIVDGRIAFLMGRAREAIHSSPNLFFTVLVLIFIFKISITITSRLSSSILKITL